jgi:hypothetical protein
MEIQSQKNGLHMILTFLWVVSQNLLPPVPLRDSPESTQLNYQYELIWGKVRPNRAGHPAAIALAMPGTTPGELTALTVVAQVLMMTMEANKSRKASREDIKDANQTTSRTNTTDKVAPSASDRQLRGHPPQTQYMKLVLACRSPNTAANQVMLEMAQWQESISVFGLH